MGTSCSAAPPTLHEARNLTLFLALISISSFCSFEDNYLRCLSGMLIPTHIRLKYWFYPIGNTPAVDLRRHSPLSSRGRTSVLSLGCGDVRNVLFTLWTERATTDRSYTFTTCDSEPAVLARNIFLLSFLTSHGPYSTSPAETLKICWELYYHLVISEKALAALQANLVALLNSVRTLED